MIFLDKLITMPLSALWFRFKPSDGQKCKATAKIIETVFDTKGKDKKASKLNEELNTMKL